MDSWRPWSSWPPRPGLNVHLGHTGSRAMSILHSLHPEAQNRALFGSPNRPAQVCEVAQLRTLHPGGHCRGPAAPHARKAMRPGPPAGLEAPLFFFFFELLSILSYLGLLNPSAGHLRPWSLSAAPDANSAGGNAFKVAPAPMKDTSKLREPVTAAPAGWIGPPSPGRSPVQPSLFSSLPGPCLGPGPADPPSNQGAGALELINGRQ